MLNANKKIERQKICIDYDSDTYGSVLPLSLSLIYYFLIWRNKGIRKYSEVCPPGYYKTENGCQQCGENTFSGWGADSCTKCPDGKVSDAGSSSITDCELGKIFSTYF